MADKEDNKAKKPPGDRETTLVGRELRPRPPPEAKYMEAIPSGSRRRLWHEPPQLDHSEYEIFDELQKMLKNYNLPIITLKTPSPDC